MIGNLLSVNDIVLMKNGIKLSFMFFVLNLGLSSLCSVIRLFIINLLFIVKCGIV